MQPSISAAEVPVECQATKTQMSPTSDTRTKQLDACGMAVLSKTGLAPEPFIGSFVQGKPEEVHHYFGPDTLGMQHAE